MADAYWRYAAADPRQQQQQPPPPSAAAGAHPGMRAAPQMAPAGGQQPMKRPRPADFSDGPGAPDMTGYYPRDEERPGYRAARDTESLNASYERFLRTGQIQSYGAGPTGEPIRPAVGGNAGYPVDERSMMAARGMDSRNIGYGGGMPEPPLPPDASNTLYIEGIPTGCTRREVSHIFRPFVGFREVRLVNKEPKHPGGDPIVLCFVDFAEATQAAIAMDALQGETDELDIYGYFPNYAHLNLNHFLKLIPNLLLVAFSHILNSLFNVENHDYTVFRYWSYPLPFSLNASSFILYRSELKPTFSFNGHPRKHARTFNNLPAPLYISMFRSFI